MQAKLLLLGIHSGALVFVTMMLYTVNLFVSDARLLVGVAFVGSYDRYTPIFLKYAQMAVHTERYFSISEGLDA